MISLPQTNTLNSTVEKTTVLSKTHSSDASSGVNFLDRSFIEDDILSIEDGILIMRPDLNKSSKKKGKLNSIKLTNILPPDTINQLGKGKFSIKAFKDVHTEYIKIVNPEKILQVYLAITEYTDARGWGYEVIVESGFGATYKYDNAMRNNKGKSLAFIECKDFKMDRNNGAQDALEEGDDQLLKYALGAYLRDTMGEEIIISSYAADGEYLFNNPLVLNQLSARIESDAKYIFTQNSHINKKLIEKASTSYKDKSINISDLIESSE